MLIAGVGLGATWAGQPHHVLAAWSYAIAAVAAAYLVLTSRPAARLLPRVSLTWPRPELLVRSAQYGIGDGKYEDVTARVVALVADGRIHFKVENGLIAPHNPFKGIIKHLVLTYSVGGRREHVVTVDEHHWVDIPTRAEVRRWRRPF